MGERTVAIPSSVDILTMLYLKTAKEAGYQTVLWSWHQDPRDWANPGGIYRKSCSEKC